MKTYCSSLAAAALAVLVSLPHAPAAAQESIAEVVTDAIDVDPDCVAGAIAAEAVAEGMKKGRQLLNRLGVNTRAPVAPCGNSGAPAKPASPRAAAPAAANGDAASAPQPQRRGFLSGVTAPRTQSSGRRNCGALGAGCADGLTPLVACMAEVTLWGELADAVQRKRDTATGLSAEDLQAMDADIAAMRAAHAADARRVTPVDPAKPNRHIDWLTPEEYSQAATAASQKINAHRQECNRKYTGF